MFNDKYGLTQAVLEGRKTQTRRICDIQPPYKNSKIAFPVDFIIDKETEKHTLYGSYCWVNKDNNNEYTDWIVPQYKEEEIVAVAQSYKDCGSFMDNGVPRWDYISQIVSNKNGGWNNKMFIKPELMPHQIRITKVRIQKLQDISDEDCLAEGIEQLPNGGGYKPYAFYDHSVRVKTEKEGVHYGKYRDFYTPRKAYAALIDKVSGKGTWDSNPYVWVYEFELIK